MHPHKEAILAETRRQFFARGAKGIGGIALANLLAENSFGTPKSDESFGGLPYLPHFAPKAKRCIYLHMMGAPPQMDLLDYKPKMKDWYDKDLPESVRQGAASDDHDSRAGALPDRAVCLSIPRNTAKAAPGFPRSCQTPRRWPTT